MHKDIFIETERLYLRQWQPTDTDTYIEMNLDKEVMEFFPSLVTPKQSLDHIQKNKTRIAEKGYGLFAVERKDDHSFIGFTGFSHPGFTMDFTPCFEIGWRFDKKHWGRGFATEAANACLQYGFEKLLLTEIYSWTSIHNTRSEQVMKKTGMQKAGEFDHPLLENGHHLQKHVLYKKTHVSFI